MYYRRRRRRREDEIRYLVGRNVDWILAPHRVKNVGSLICVCASLDQVVWQTAKPWKYYAEATWTYFGAAALQRLMEC